MITNNMTLYYSEFRLIIIFFFYVSINNSMKVEFHVFLIKTLKKRGFRKTSSLLFKFLVKRHISKAPHKKNSNLFAVFFKE